MEDKKRYMNFIQNKIDSLNSKINAINYQIETTIKLSFDIQKLKLQDEKYIHVEYRDYLQDLLIEFEGMFCKECKRKE